MRLWRALYARAEVEEAVDSARNCCRDSRAVDVRGMAARIGNAKMAFRDAIVVDVVPVKAVSDIWGVLPVLLHNV